MLCFYCSLFINWIWKFLGEKNSQNNDKPSSRFILLRKLFLISIIIYFIISGVSLLLLDRKINFQGSKFYNKITIEKKEGEKVNCLSSWPWSSWYLNKHCSSIWLIDISQEYWKGSNTDQFYRFENNLESSLLVAANHTKLYWQRKSPWFEQDEIFIYMDTAKTFPWKKSKMEIEGGINHIFLSGGINLCENEKEFIEISMGTKLRNPLPATRAFFSEIMMGQYLQENFNRIVEISTLSHRYDISRFYRETGIWYFIHDAKNEWINNQAYQFIYWRRKN
jgi:hypothetical protein